MSTVVEACRASLTTLDGRTATDRRILLSHEGPGDQRGCGVVTGAGAVLNTADVAAGAT
jgi:hypothetical protein